MTSIPVLAYFLVGSLLSTVLATVIALIFGKRFHWLSNVILAIGGLFGVLATIPLILGLQPALIIPQDLYAAASASQSAASWYVLYDMVFGLDRFSAIFYFLLSIVSTVVAVYAIPYLERYSTSYNLRYVNALTGVFILGMQGVVLSTNIIGFMTFWELMSVASFFLVLTDGTEKSRQAGFLYLFMAHLSASAIMAGLFLLSGGALLSDFSVLAAIAPQLPSQTVAVALGLLLFGFGSKAGLVPFHVWLPEAHPQAPASVSALMSGVMLKVAVYGLLRVLLFMVPAVPVWFIVLVLVSGAWSAILGVLYAVLERDLKRLLAYSSIENIGMIFMMIGVGLMAGKEGIEELAQVGVYAALLLIVAHGLFKTGLFLASGTIIQAVHSQQLEVMGGLAKRMPKLSVIVFGLALAAAAMPPFGAFIAEWAFIQALLGSLAASSSLVKVMLVILLPIMSFTAGLALFAMVKMYALVFLANPRSEAAEKTKEPVAMLIIPSAVMAVLGLLLGLFSPYLLNHLGAESLASLAVKPGLLMAGGGTLEPMVIFGLMIAIVGGLFALRQWLSDPKHERVYQTWDCGQPITPNMEYTATAFSGPIRFIFRFFSQSQKTIQSKQLHPSNPWMVEKSVVILDREVWYHRVYLPVGKIVKHLATWAGKVQNGRIQFYITMVIVALLLTLLIAV